MIKNTITSHFDVVQLFQWIQNLEDMEKYFVCITLERIEIDHHIDRLLHSIDQHKKWTCLLSDGTDACYHSLSVVHPFMKKRDDLTPLIRRSSSGDMSAHSQAWLRLDNLLTAQDKKSAVLEAQDKKSAVLEAQDKKSAVLEAFDISSAVDGDHCDTISHLGMVNVVHHLADTFRASGYTLYVMLLLGAKSPSIDDHLALYGAVKRLYLSYKADITILYWNETQVHNLTAWQKCLNARLVSKDASSWLPTPRYWSGSLVVRDNQTYVELPNFVLQSAEAESDVEWKELLTDCGLDQIAKPDAENNSHCSKPMYTHLSSTMEILEPDIAVATVPLHLYTGRKLELILDPERCTNAASAWLTERLQKDAQSCCIVRLRMSLAPPGGECVCTAPVILRCKKTDKTGTEIWKERLQTTLTSQVEDFPLPGLNSSRVFVLIGGVSGSSVCHAYLLHQAGDFHGVAITSLVAPLAFVPHGEDKQADVRLAQFSRGQFQRIDDDICKLQKQALTEWLASKRSRDKRATVTAEELVTIMTGIKTGYYYRLSALLQQTVVNGGVEDWSKQQNKHVIDPNQCSEKLALMELERRSDLARADTGTISVQEKTDAAAGLDVTEFLKMFLLTGEAVEKDLSPVHLPMRRSRTSRYANINGTRAITEPFPQVTACQFHDVYYNIGKKSDLKELHFRHLRDKDVSYETWCSLDKNAPPLSFAVPAVQKSKAKRHIEDKLRHRGDLLIEPESKLNSMTEDKRELENDPKKQNRHRRELTRVSALPSHVSALPSHVSALPSHVSALPSHVSALPSHVSALPSHVRCSLRRTVSAAGLDTSQRESITPMPSGGGATSDRQLVQSQVEKRARFARNNQKLSLVVESVLSEHSIPPDHKFFRECRDKLFHVTKVFVRDLKTSRHLESECRRVAEKQVKLIIAEVCH